MKRTPGSTSAERENYWTELITRAREHHLSVQEFCEQEGISSNNYYSWFKKLRPEHPEWKKDLPPHGAKKEVEKKEGKDQATGASRDQSAKGQARPKQIQSLWNCALEVGTV